MKKIILSSLFSVALVFGSGNIATFANDLGPIDPATPPVTEPTDSSEPTNPTEPVDPAEPSAAPTDPTEPSKPTEPTAPSEPEKPAKPTTPIDPGTPVEPAESNGPTEPSQPTESTTPGEPEEPVTPEQPKEPAQPVIPEKSAEPGTSKTPEQPAKPINVVTTPSREIDKTNQSARTQPSIPIETSNLAEIVHVSSETTPITTEAGREIVAVDRSVPLTKIPERLKSVSSSYKVLPSRNVKVKASGGRIKVLPYAGERSTLLFSVSGSFFVLISGFFFLKKSKKKA